MSSIEWIVLVYKVPSDPTKYRAAIWREIKRLGGVYLQDGVCIFPDIDDVALNVSALADYVRQSNGTEYILLTRVSNKEQTAELIAQFQGNRNQEYKHLLDELNQLALRVESPKESASFPLLFKWDKLFTEPISPWTRILHQKAWDCVQSHLDSCINIV